MTSDQPVVRFAPSPNGELHLGHAFSALYTQAQARRLGARLLLRIEDIDLVRSRTTFIEQIFDDLAWLGLEWEQPVRRQSEHLGVYRDALARLDALGVVFRCFASRQEIRAAIAGYPTHRLDPDGAPIYPGLDQTLDAHERARRLGSGAPHAMRLDSRRAAALAVERNGGPVSFEEHECGPRGETGRIEIDAALWGDVIIARKDVRTSYHLSVVVDDALQGVSHVTRGQDLFYTTHIHRVLQVLLDLPEPRYFHHQLVRDATGRRLSKSARDQGLRALRESGVSAREVRSRLGFA